MPEHSPAVAAVLRERLRTLEEAQRATLNILDDFDAEKAKLTQFQQATMNLLEDFDEERQKLQQVQKAALNLLEDADAERQRYQQVQRATLNLLEDMNEERNRLADTQRAVLNMLEDIEGERAHAERAKQQLEAANRELEAFSYSVSHDLRAPLRAISGFVDAVIEDYAPKLDEEGRRYLGLVRDNAHNMGQLIDDLLAFSRLGRQQMRDSLIDMQPLAATVFEEQVALNPGRKVRFIQQPVPPVHGDATLIRQVLVNLFSNALKFTKTRAETVVEFGSEQQADAVVYYVRDNGVGFDMKYAGRLFGVFQRLHAVTDFEGTGVGLALVSRIITRHGGRVWAHGEPNHGATFFFTLPKGGVR